MKSEDRVYTRLCDFLSEAPFFQHGEGWEEVGRMGTEGRGGTEGVG